MTSALISVESAIAISLLHPLGALRRESVDVQSAHDRKIRGRCRPHSGVLDVCRCGGVARPASCRWRAHPAGRRGGRAAAGSRLGGRLSRGGRSGQPRPRNTRAGSGGERQISVHRESWRGSRRRRILTAKPLAASGAAIGLAIFRRRCSLSRLSRAGTVLGGGPAARPPGARPAAQPTAIRPRGRIPGHRRGLGVLGEHGRRPSSHSARAADARERGGRFYELYVADDDRSYFDALLIGQRIYRRDLVSGDSVQVFEDVRVTGIARSYATDAPGRAPIWTRTRTGATTRIR